MPPPVTPTGPHPPPLTFVFADAEGFTELTESLGDEGGARCIEQFHQVITELGACHNGVEISRMGDLLFLVFEGPDDAVACARAIPASLAGRTETAALRCRIGIHTGAAFQHGATFIGTSVNKAARIAAMASGGQILLSEETWQQLSDRSGVVFQGHSSLRGLQGTHAIYRVGGAVLPAQPPAEGQDSTFIGRERLVRQVFDALGQARLVALIGPSGIGKTRTAREVLQRAAAEGRFPIAGCASFADCVDDPDVFESALQFQARECLAAATPALLLLDNFETVASCGAALPALVREHGHLRVLVTSTVPLDAGELGIVVPPMEHRRPTDEPGPETESVKLFRQRALEWGADWERGPEDRLLAERICGLLEGVPLAIELAAGQLPGTRLTVLEDELRSARLKPLEARAGARRHPRHSALRTALAYSFSHLSPPQRRVLLRCSVLVGDFDAPAARTLCESDVSAVLDALVSRGLLRKNGGGSDERFSMLESIREFAHEQLGALRGRFEESAAAYFLRLAEECDRDLLTERQVGALQSLQRELPHLRAGMDWSIRNGKPGWAARYACAIWPVLLYRGLATECEERIRAGIAAAAREGDARMECTLWCRLTGPLQTAGRHADLEPVCRRGIEMAEELAEPHLAARCLLSLGAAVGHLDRPEEARRCYDEALKRYEELQDEWGLGQAYEEQARLAESQGDLSRAAAACERALAIVRKRGDRWSEQRLLELRADVALGLGEKEHAEELLAQGAGLCERLGFNEKQLPHLVQLARLARGAGRMERARGALSLCFAAAHHLGASAPPGLYLEAGAIAALDRNPRTAMAFLTDGVLLAIRERDPADALANVEALISLARDSDPRLVPAIEPLRLALARGELPDESEVRRAFGG